jgi:DNA repair exonuclease SbcCD nuclease subunit
LVDLAIQEHVTLLCLSGDVVDQDNKFWEAIGPLERGIGRLAAANIRTIAVAGNHDYDVLGRLADQFQPEHFTLLGRGGTWERLTIDEAGQPILHIDGWSFPQQRVHESPLLTYPLEPDPDVPILGMIHGDLDVASTPYAPLELPRLRALSSAGWLLGHIHAPRLVNGSPWVLYPGSLQALDPGEPGAHGAWIVELSDSTLGVPKQRPLSRVWYGQREIDLSGTSSETELESLLLNEIRSESDRIAAEAGPHLVSISLRLRLVGSTSISYRVAEIAKRITDDLCLSAGAASIGIEKVDVQTIPPIDLAQHAATHTAPGAVGRVLLELEQIDVSDEVTELIKQTCKQLQHSDGHRDFAHLDRREVTDEMAREYLQKQGRALITQLVNQTA